MTKLREYMGDMDKSLIGFVDAFEDHFGPLERVGGNRVYDIEDEGKRGALFVTHGLTGVGFGWSNPNIIETVYLWNHFNFETPDYALDIPPDINLHTMMPLIVDALETQRKGRIN